MTTENAANKKSCNKKGIALGVVIAAGVIWAGSTWYIGKQIETRKDEMIAKINTVLSERFPTQKLSVSTVNYHRGFFSSTTQVVFQSAATGDDAVFSPDDQLVFNTTIEHGPFPVSALKQFKLAPSLAMVHNELSDNKLAKPLFEVSNNVSPLISDSIVGFSGGTSSTIRVAALETAKEGEDGALKTGEFILHLDADKDGENITTSGSWPSVTASYTDEMGLPTTLKLNDLTFNGNRVTGTSGLPTGDSSASIKSLAFSKGETSLALNDLALNSGAQEAQGKYAGNAKYHVASIKLNNADLGSADLQLSMKNLDAAVMKKVVEQYRLALQESLSGENSEAAEAASQKLAAEFKNLLKGSPAFSVDTLKLKNSAGESTFDFNLALKDGDLKAESLNNVPELLQNTVQTLNTHLSVNQAMAEEMAKQIVMAQGLDEETAKAAAKQSVAQFAMVGEMTQLVKNQDGKVTTDLSYSDGKVTLNGKTQPLADFLAQYIPSGMGMDESQDFGESDDAAAPDDEPAYDEEASDAAAAAEDGGNTSEDVAPAQDDGAVSDAPATDDDSDISAPVDEQ